MMRMIHQIEQNFLKMQNMQMIIPVSFLAIRKFMNLVVEMKNLLDRVIIEGECLCSEVTDPNQCECFYCELLDIYQQYGLVYTDRQGVKN